MSIGRDREATEVHQSSEAPLLEADSASGDSPSSSESSVEWVAPSFWRLLPVGSGSSSSIPRTSSAGCPEIRWGEEVNQ